MSSAWKRTAAWLGLIEEYDDEYEETASEHGAVRAGAPASRGSAEAGNVRRFTPARSVEAPASSGGGTATATAVRPIASGAVHVTEPTTFNDIEEVGQRFRNGVPVIMNLAEASEQVAKRLLDFASGLIYGLDGRIERVADRVFLLTPLGVEVSSEERTRLRERGFFNQA